MVTPGVMRVGVPTLAHVVPPKYHHWVSTYPRQHARPMAIRVARAASAGDAVRKRRGSGGFILRKARWRGWRCFSQADAFVCFVFRDATHLFDSLSKNCRRRERAAARVWRRQCERELRESGGASASGPLLASRLVAFWRSAFAHTSTRAPMSVRVRALPLAPLRPCVRRHARLRNAGADAASLRCQGARCLDCMEAAGGQLGGAVCPARRAHVHARAAPLRLRARVLLAQGGGYVPRRGSRIRPRRHWILLPAHLGLRHAIPAQPHHVRASATLPVRACAFASLHMPGRSRYYFHADLSNYEYL
eukprot:2106116-Pleurochrysis_carterae.AAC.1